MRTHWFLSLPVLVGSAFLYAESDPLDTIEGSTSAWIELRAETTRLTTAWQTEQTLLESTIAALEERATSAEEERDLERAKHATDREELDVLAQKVKDGMTDQKAFEARLLELTETLVRLRAFLPPRLSDALDVSFASLAGSELSPGERIQLTVSVLNRCIQFSRTVTATDEVLRLDPSSEGRMFEVIYWGLSHGYAVDRASGKAWYGAPGAKGWQWEPREGLADAALHLISIYKDERDPEFVMAPARLARPIGRSPQP